MKQWTIGTRILFNSGVLCLILIIISGVGIWGISGLQKIGLAISDDSLPGIALSAKLAILRLKNEALLLQYLQTMAPDERQRLKDQIESNHTAITEALNLYKPTIHAAEDQANFDAVQPKRAASKTLRDTILAASPAEGSRIYQEQYKAVSEEYGQLMDTIVAYNVRTGAENGPKLKSLVTILQWTLSVLSVLGIGIAIALSLQSVAAITVVLKELSVRLSGGANQVASAAEEVSNTSQTMADGSSEQAAALEETSASTEEISSMTKRNAESADSAQLLSSETKTAAELGAAKTEEMQQAIHSITLASDEMAQAIEGIRASSADVAKIIKTIDEIAFQTNILALNAAVEAARAGEAGMGFAVVADEVRNLAQRCATAAKETSQMIETAVSQSARGVESNKKVTSRVSEITQKSEGVRESLNDIVNKARQVDTLISTIASASKEQTLGLDQIAHAMTQVDQVTQKNAAGAEETASAAEEMNAQASELRAAVTVLRGLIEGRDKSAIEGSAFEAAARMEAHQPTQTRLRATAALPARTVQRRESARLPATATRLR